MKTRGIRGAISVEANTKEAILAATQELLLTMKKHNNIAIEDICSIIFTVTSDLDADFPASAARKMGWDKVPLLCGREIPVPGSPPMIIRVLLQINTVLSQDDIQFVYRGRAQELRDDIAKIGDL